MRDALARSRRVRPDELLAGMTERQVKAVCEHMGVDPKGRKRALIRWLLGSKSKLPTRTRQRRPLPRTCPPSTSSAASRSSWTECQTSCVSRRLGTTEQEASGATFRVDYVKPSGAIGFYYPDWVAVQREMNGEIINWVIETKGRVWEGTEEKDDAMYDWCQGVSRTTGDSWKYIPVN